MTPQVLHIGFSKCGSSYLRALFRGHPGINLVWKSGFFTPSLYTSNPSRPTTLDQYRAMFDKREGLLTVESDEHLTMPSVHPRLGVRGTNIADFERLVGVIARLLPGAKIIMIIRNQPALLVSRYSEYLIAGGKLEFDEFVSQLMGYDGDGNCYFQNYYEMMIDVLARHFSSEQLLILAQEEMASDIAAMTANIARFLTLSDPFVAASGFLSERKSLSLGGMSVLRAVNRFLVRQSSFAGAPPLTRGPWFVYHNIIRAIRLFDHMVLGQVSGRSSSLLTKEVRRSLLEHFEPHNRLLKRHFNGDLVAMGYLATSDAATGLGR